jgi:hypothetical protein
LSLGDVFASPIVSHGRFYVSTDSGLYCIGKNDQQPAVDPLPKQPPELPQDDATPAQLQVAPVESLLRPGLRQQFQVRLFNKNGQMIRAADTRDVKFTLDGPGSIDSAGRYSTPTETDKHAATIVTAQFGDLTGTARIRIVPDLPWSFDFSDGEVPVTWVGARYRHIPMDFALLKSLEARNPLAAQLHIYLSSDFVNTGQPTQVYDDSTPRMRWTEFLRFLKLLDNAAVLQTVDGAKAALDPALAVLKDERILSEWSWSQANGGPQLTVAKGKRGIDPEHAVMMKITTIPKGTRSQGWMGPVDFQNYTIQADVLSAAKGGQMGDVGIIGQRYALDLMGAHQQLQVRTWHSQQRMAKAVPFKWEPNVWYTLKLRSAVERDKAVLRCKVWRRDEAEPEKWQLEADDKSPNLTGSPGLYADATNAEIFYDNIKVTKN